MKNTNKTFSLITILIFAIIFSSQSMAGQQTGSIKLKPGHPQQYTVVKGDTLWDISGVFLDEPWYWPEIWQVNPQIDNPHLIYPGDVLNLIYVDGRPYITRDKYGKRTVRLGPQIRYEELNKAIPTIPLDIIAPYLTENLILNPNQYSASPYIVSINDDDHLAGSADSTIYVMGIGRENTHKDFGIYRRGQVFRSPVNNQVLGYEAIYLGGAIMERPGNPATLYVQSSKAEILKGHRAIAIDNNQIVDANFLPKKGTINRPGNIVGVLTNGRQPGVSIVGAMDVVIIDLGSEDGVEKGDVLNIYKKGNTVKDPLVNNRLIKLPDEKSGNLMIFRTFNRLSYALVMDADRMLRVGDVLHSPTE